MIIIPTPAGDFRTRVQLVQRITSSPNELGETTLVDQVLASVWAKISPATSTEVTANAENTLDVTHDVRLRYSAQLTHADAIKFSGRTLEILDIRDVEEQHRELAITCHEQRT